MDTPWITLFERICVCANRCGLAVLVAMLSLVGCGPERMDYAKAVDDMLRINAKHQPALPEPRRDESLTTSQWIDRGMPSPARRWTGDEYRSALRVLDQELASTAPLLPKLGSSRSGDVFAKIIAIRPEITDAASRTENYAVLEALLYGEVSRLLYFEQRYIAAHWKSGAYDIELAEFGAAELKLSALRIEGARRLYESGPTPLPHRRLSDLNELRDRLGGAVMASIPSLLDQRAFGSSARRRVARSLSEGFPSFAGDLLPEHRAQIDAFLARAETGDADPEVRRLVTVARQALAKGTTSRLQQAALARGLK
jgi:hypothetical protein